MARWGHLGVGQLGAPWPPWKVLDNLFKTNPPQQRLTHLSSPISMPTSRMLSVAMKSRVGIGLVGKTAMCTCVLACAGLSGSVMSSRVDVQSCRLEDCR